MAKAICPGIDENIYRKHVIAFRHQITHWLAQHIFLVRICADTVDGEPHRLSEPRTEQIRHNRSAAYHRSLLPKLLCRRDWFEAYLDKVFGVSDLVSALPKGRQFPQHSWKQVFDAVFFSAAMQIPSLLQMEAECHHGALARRIGPVSDDTIGYALERQSPQPVFELSREVARRLKRNGVLRSDWSRGLGVGVVDGIEICGSIARCCDACREREVQHKVQGEISAIPKLPGW
jgi:hypothetical protein